MDINSKKMAYKKVFILCKICFDFNVQCIYVSSNEYKWKNNNAPCLLGSYMEMPLKIDIKKIFEQKTALA